jgi:Fe-S cluster assembly iron-binding protein IscA
MLMLTDTAAAVIKELAAQLDLPETAGLRISPTPEGTGETALAAVLAGAPDPQDSVVEVRHARVFLEPEAADHLNDKILDAETQNGGKVMFHLRSQLTPEDLAGSDPA